MCIKTSVIIMHLRHWCFCLYNFFFNLTSREALLLVRYQEISVLSFECESIVFYWLLLHIYCFVL